MVSDLPPGSGRVGWEPLAGGRLLSDDGVGRPGSSGRGVGGGVPGPWFAPEVGGAPGVAALAVGAV
ncbi:hypothetical protein, partial [Actinoalloteichus spitiensis]|uniref:hypothetical protein n=1 Tax=Actinoalloteichus spitiensis TaxID=252394 RepID=UPI0005850835